MRKNNSVRVSVPRFLDEQPGDDDEEMTEADWAMAIEEGVNLAIAAVQNVRSACRKAGLPLVMLRTNGDRPTVMLADLARDLPDNAILMAVSPQTTDDEIVSRVSAVVTRDVLALRVFVESVPARLAAALGDEEAQIN